MTIEIRNYSGCQMTFSLAKGREICHNTHEA